VVLKFVGVKVVAVVLAVVVEVGGCPHRSWALLIEVSINLRGKSLPHESENSFLILYSNPDANVLNKSVYYYRVTQPKIIQSSSSNGDDDHDHEESPASHHNSAL